MVGALQALHEGTEHQVIKILDSANLCAIHAQRVTLMPKDIQLAKQLLEIDTRYKMPEIMTGTGGAMERERNARAAAATAQQQHRRDMRGGRGENRSSSRKKISTMMGEVVLMMTMTVGEEGVAPLQDVVVLFRNGKIREKTVLSKRETKEIHRK